VEDIFKYECIMGMDLITRILEYLKYIQVLRETVGVKVTQSIYVLKKFVLLLILNDGLEKGRGF
jgi:hypothetical protein